MNLRRIIAALIALDAARQLVKFGYRRGVTDAIHHARSLDA